MSKSKIAILTSCAGYGTYIPSILLSKELNNNLIENKVFVYENYLSINKRDKFLQYRKNFHNSFRYAQTASSVSVTIKDDIDYASILKDFKNYGCDYFIVMFGTWINILSKFNMDNDKVLSIRLDVINTPSWERVSELNYFKNELWLIGKNSEIPKYTLFNEEYISPKKNRIIVHGGGWGINNFDEVINKLSKLCELNVIFSTKAEALSAAKDRKINAFYTPIDWMPDSNHIDVPPLYDAQNDALVNYRDILKTATAMISKPGGGTCLDSILLKIPFVYLQGMAKHENHNGISMEKFGFGVSFEIWEQENFNFKTLDNIRQNIIIKTKDLPTISDMVKRLVENEFI